MTRSAHQLRVVLDERLRAERIKQRAVADIHIQRMAIETRITTVSRSLGSIREELRSALDPATTPGGVAFGDVRLQAGATLHAQMHLHAHAVELAGVLKRLRIAQEELRDAAARRKAVELLISRRRLEAQRVAARRETAELDEISISRFRRTEDGTMSPSTETGAP